MSEKISIHWFRKGLRLHDNQAFQDACFQASQVYPIFILDPYFANPEKVGVLRYNFLLESLHDLDTQLREKGSRLFLLRGEPLSTLEQHFHKWNINNLTFEKDTEPYAKRRDAEVCKLAESMGVAVSAHSSHTLHELDRYLGLAKSTSPPGSYTGFLKLFAKAGPPPTPVPAPREGTIPPDKSGSNLTEYAVPSLQEVGYPALQRPTKYPGGEREALRRLNLMMEKRSWVAKFEKPNTSPNSLEPSTTVLSPYLKFGCLSSRLFFYRLEEVYASVTKHSSPPVSLHGQLLWREFFYLCGHAVPNFGKMIGNPICKQIPWNNNPAHLKAWEDGETGYPFIDAIMTQLKEEGWMHHLARHAVACFLTRGDLWVSWEEGAKVFDKYLLDADWSLNNANWMWLSCSSFFYMYYRCYSPVAFGKKTDPDGLFIKKYLPKLSKFPKQYIYEPWKAPKTVQVACGCIIGVVYPRPIVVHEEVSKANMEKMKQAYAAGQLQRTLTSADVQQGSSQSNSQRDNSVSKRASLNINQQDCSDIVKKTGKKAKKDQTNSMA